MRNTYPKDIPICGRTRACLDLVKRQPLKGRIVVDIGSSFGWFEKELLGSGARLIGVEPNKDAVEFAQNYLPRKVKFIIGDALNIPLEDEVAGIVVFFDVIEHLPSGKEKNALKEIRRILKKDGILLLSTPNSRFLMNFLDPAWYFGHRHYTDREITSLLKESGFEILEHKKKGGFLSIAYMLWFYIMKWIFRKVNPRGELLEFLDDLSYTSDNGFFTHLIVAKKGGVS